MDGTRSFPWIPILTVVDQLSRECPLREAGVSMTGKAVAKAVGRLSFSHPLPRVITVDNGSEFFPRAMDSWAYRHSVQLEFIQPGKAMDNAFIESFNGRLRDECLDAHLFFSIEDARRELEVWRANYNTQRPHRSLVGRSPRELLEDHEQEATGASILNL